MAGKLYIVSTPIGNLGDFSPRAQLVLAQVDFIAAEDTRVGAKLLNKFEIKKPQVSYFEHNRKAKGQQIAERILAGENCALITDAGTPAISDPGTDLVAICAEMGVEAVAVPGCCAAAAALSISGMECGRWCFEGFLSVNKKSRREHLAAVKNETRTMVFYEAPHKLLKTLQDFYATFGQRKIALCREITKLHEQVLRMTLSEAVEYYQEHEPKGEFVLVVAGADQPLQEESGPDPMELVGGLLEEGKSISEAVKTVSRQLNLPKNALYQQALEAFSEK
ncbi:16S rRNA (cytidine(1402)-2'-O)-methyltransferase [Acidaminobacterium chupaoyuni]